MVIKRVEKATMSERPRILHLRVAAGTGGGPEKTILNSPKFIRQYGFDAQVAYLCPPGDPLADSLKTRAQECDCPLTVIPDRGFRDWRVLTQVISHCRRERIDILQAHDYKSNFIGLLVRRFHRCRLATMLHGWTDMSGRMPLYKRIDKWCLPGYEALICVSEDLVEECQQLKIPEQKIFLIHNAIDTAQFKRRFTTNQAKSIMGAKPERFLIGSVGRLSPEKCFAELIDIVIELQNSGKPVDLWIAGDGAERDALQQKIDKLGRGDSIRLLGQISETKTFYQAMNLFVLNSIREGLPNVVLEAMALETPVIATRIAGIPALIKHGVTGQLIEPSDSVGLRKAIENAILDEQTQATHAFAARRLIEDQFSFDLRMKKIAAIYGRLLKRHSTELE